MVLLDGHALEHLHGLGQQEWIDKAQERVDIMQDLYGLHSMEPIHGGRSGAVVRCIDEEGRKVVLKIMLPGDLGGQVIALGDFQGRRVPRILTCEESLCAILIEDLGGAPQSRDREIDLRLVVEMIEEWQGLQPSPSLPNQYERVEYWAGMVLQKVQEEGDREAERALDWALEFSRGLPMGEELLHADLGCHNLVHDEQGRLCAVDPTGARGDRAYDLGSLALWGGVSVLDTPARCFVLSEYTEIPLERIEAWAAVRCALSVGFASARQDLSQRADCLYILRDLIS